MRTTLLLTIILLLLNGCDQASPIITEASSRPVKTLLIETSDPGALRRFPARIDAGRKAELAFRVPGKVKELLVREGDKVKKDQILAKLDDQDFQIVVNDREAIYQNARQNFNRASELIEKGHISRKDYDQLEAQLKTSRAGLDAARQDLSYTRLKAPFDGEIARRHIERFEEVQAKQPVLSLHDLSQLLVKFDVPESLIRNLRADQDGGAKARDLIVVSASFDNLPGRNFPLRFQEIATQADAQTQTFEVTYTMERVGDIRIFAGMTANATADMSGVRTARDSFFTVPSAAIVGDYKLAPHAWVVDPKTMTVHPRAVKVRRLKGSSIEVLEGLMSGDRIVVAGTPFLVEGMHVSLLPNLEQAEPRQVTP